MYYENFIVSYLEADEKTYGYQTFESKEDAQAYYNKMVMEECEKVYLSEILKAN